MKKMLKNAKGLTLVELLAVIVILGIVAAIAVPAIGNTIEKSKTKADLGSYDMIVDAAIRWSIEEQADGNAGTTSDVSISDKLVDAGYLAKAPSKFNTAGQLTPATFSVSKNATGGITVVIKAADGTTISKNNDGDALTTTAPSSGG